MLLFSVLEIEMSDCECESEESAPYLPELVFYVNGKKVSSFFNRPIVKNFILDLSRFL